MAGGTRSKHSSVTRRTQAARRDLSEGSLLGSAIDIIAEQGVNAASFSAIARRAGYSSGLASAHFGSKQGLMEAIIAHLRHRSETTFAANGLDDRPGLEAILAYLRIFFDDLTGTKENRAYVRLLSSALADLSPWREALAGEHRRMLQLFEDFVIKGQDEGQIRSDLLPSAAALMIGTMIVGTSAQTLVYPKVAPGAVGDACIDTVRFALATTSHSAGDR